MKVDRRQFVTSTLATFSTIGMSSVLNGPADAQWAGFAAYAPRLANAMTRFVQAAGAEGVGSYFGNWLAQRFPVAAPKPASFHQVFDDPVQIASPRPFIAPARQPGKVVAVNRQANYVTESAYKQNSLAGLNMLEMEAVCSRYKTAISGQKSSDQLPAFDSPRVPPSLQHIEFFQSDFAPRMRLVNPWLDYVRVFCGCEGLMLGLGYRHLDPSDRRVVWNSFYIA